MKPRRLLTCLVAVCLGVFASAASPFSISIQPLFKGHQKETGMIPMKVAVRNAGPDAIGSLHIQSSDYQMDYPLELPEGSQKDLTVYVKSNSDLYDSAIEVRTDRGRATKQIDPAGMTPSPGEYFLEIGGNPGDFAFLDGDQAASGQVSPEEAPDRLAAYSGCVMVYLASGSERLSDPSVKALKLYILQGGLVIFPGGVATPLLSDGRWAGILPVTPLQAHSERDDSLLIKIAAVEKSGSKFGSPRIRNAYSVLDFKPLPGSKVATQAGRNLIGTHNYGLGTAAFLGIDPLASPIRDWSGLPQFFKRTAHQALPDQESSIHLPDEEQTYLGHGHSYSGSVKKSRPEPFPVQMPAPKQIGLILALYFFLIIPANFFVLKKLGKRQWGWTSSSVISLVFTGVVLLQARTLYGLSTSHSDTVVVVGQAGFESAVALGGSRMFAQQSGTYDLQLNGVDSVESNDFSYDFGARASQLEMFSPVDIGEVKMPGAKFPNLGFGAFKYVQILDGSNLASVTKTNTRIKIYAKSKLVNAVLMSPRGNALIGSVAANGTFYDPKFANRSVPEEFHQYAESIKPWVDHGESVLIANMPDLPCGIVLGKRLIPSPVVIEFLGNDL